MARSVFDNGGIIGTVNTPNTSIASGVWNLNALYDAVSSYNWPGIFVPPGQQIYTTPGTYNFTVPAGITQISFVAIGAGGTGDDGNEGDGGGGGGGGGALAYANNVNVTSGMTIVITVGERGTNGNGKGIRAQNGGNTTINISSFVAYANGGTGGAPYSTNPGSVGGTFGFANIPAGANTGGGFGGTGGGGYDGGGGGGGAGGYTGFGGNGSYSLGSTTTAVGYGAGGGGGAGTAASVGLNGGGSGGTGQYNTTGGGGGGATIFSVANPAVNGANGNGLTSAGSKGGDGGFPGGGGGGSWDNSTGVAANGANGIVKILWGTGRSFPYNANDV